MTTELTRRDRLTLAHIPAAVIVQSKGGLAVAENVGDRAV
jgi:hypothetical protein